MSASTQTPIAFTTVNTRVSTITNGGIPVDTSESFSTQTISFSTITGFSGYVTTTAATASVVAYTEEGSAASAASTSSALSSGDGSKSNDNGGLDTGAAAGVGVGATLGAVIVILLLYMIWRRQRAKRKTRGKSVLHSDGEGGGEMASSSGIPPILAEKDGAQRVEAPEAPSLAEADGESIAELDAGEKAVEVQGDWKAVEAGEGRTGGAPVAASDSEKR